MSNRTVPAAAEGLPCYEKQFDALEGPIGLVLRRVRATAYITGLILDKKQGQFGEREISESLLDTLAVLAFDSEDASKALEALWAEGFNASSAAEVKL